MSSPSSYGRSLESTPTWAVAVVVFVLVAISLVLELILHHVGSWLQKRKKSSLYEALDKIKAVGQEQLVEICIPRNIGHSWHPCNYEEDEDDENPRYRDRCVSSMRKWKSWEKETKTIQYQYYNDPERFRFARDTSFGRRHLHFWSKSPVLLWIVCFFRQFFTSVEKVDYVTLRHGFIAAHLTPQSHASFDFQKYINRSLERDFKVVVGISPIMWLFAILFLLANTNGWHSQFWLPFIPLVAHLTPQSHASFDFQKYINRSLERDFKVVVGISPIMWLFAILFLLANTNGAKLQVIITKMGIRILERGDIIKGTPTVQPGDDLFWFKSPKLILFLIHFVLFQNAFQLAFFAWSWYEFGYPSCYHQNLADIIIRIVMGVLIQFLCSYVTLPLYALVTQMGSTMKPVIFSDQVASALRGWHHTAKKQLKQQGRQSGNTTPFSSRPGTPMRGNMSPVYLLRGLQNNHDSIENGFQISPRASSFSNEGWGGGEGTSVSPRHHEIETDDSMRNGMNHSEIEIDIEDPRPNNVEAQHKGQISLSDFSFRKKMNLDEGVSNSK
ncbi:hypothetical protein RD792_007955 [Penstemon davidsonii]|uniref:MLO-like protein n=1 Tax=Penstemon davidsonii TaxID=160366 RepID=A0ABR0D7R8_9LAMI|nr:hypothetical protein RD792_007955 [Penstemon davidsonii]